MLRFNLYTLLFLSFSLTSLTYASDWICIETASVKQGNAFLVCGIGEAKTEQEARLEALQYAKKEFKEICSESPNCRNHQLEFEPLRNSCEKVANGFKCYRALRYVMTKKLSPGAPRLSKSSSALIPIGWIILGVTYTSTVITTLAVSDSYFYSTIPFVGPFIQLDSESEGIYDVLNVISGVLQFGGLTMALIGYAQGSDDEVALIHKRGHFAFFPLPLPNGVGGMFRLNL